MPTPPWLWKTLPLSAQVVPPGRCGVGTSAVAVTAAIPRRSSCCTEVISLLSPATLLESWLRLTASVRAVPGATLVICRAKPVVSLPTDTVPARSASEPWPSATELTAVTNEFAPRAVPFIACTFAFWPRATELVVPAYAPSPIATDE
jgi:hypothetical protein